MTIRRQTENRKVTYILNTIHQLKHVDQENDIGVIIDSNIEFDKQINK